MNSKNTQRDRQKGVSLLVALVLLLVLTILVFFGVKVGVLEQRTAANDFRAKLVHQAAESGLDHAVEYLKLRANLVSYGAGQTPDATLWELCTAADDTFPCGSVPAAQRPRMYRFIGGTDRDGNGTVDTFEDRMLPFSQAFQQVGAFPVEYGVGALLCTLNDVAGCTSTASARTGRSVITLVSRAEMDGENARTTITKAVGTFSLFGIPDSVPPIVAAGLITGLGSSRIVPNPDAGGPGVPVSIWSRKAINGGMGSWKTCQPEDYFRNCSSTSIDAGVAICNNQGGMPNACTDFSGSMATIELNIDVMDPSRTVNLAATEGVSYLPSTYFPCDLFEYIFQVRARDDIDGDGFCEGKTAEAAVRTQKVDEFLERNATVPTGGCGGLNSNSRGLYWVKGDCSLPGSQVGSPANPVIIVADGDIDVNTGMRVFGLIFARHPFGYLNPDGAADHPEWPPGGGTGEVYGAVVLEGAVKINANVDIVYSRQVIQNINTNPANTAFGNVTGSWTDRDSY